MKKTMRILYLVAISTMMASATVYQNYEMMDASKWRVYDATPSGATIEVVKDELSDWNVIQLKGDGTKNGYILGNWSGDKAWKNNMGTKINWFSRFNENFVVYVSVETQKGHRYLYYTPVDRDYGINTSKTYIHHGLGSEEKDGEWRGHERDLEKDLQEFESDNSILYVNAFLVRGSGYLSEIEIRDSNYGKIITLSGDGNKIFISNGYAVSSLDASYLNFEPYMHYTSKEEIKDMVASADGSKLYVLHSNSLKILDKNNKYYTYLPIATYPVTNGISFVINKEETKAYVSRGKQGVVAIDIK